MTMTDKGLFTLLGPGVHHRKKGSSSAFTISRIFRGKYRRIPWWSQHASDGMSLHLASHL